MAEIFCVSSTRVDDRDGPDKRVNLPVNLTPAAREVIKGLKLSTGMTQQAAVERILQWFADQPEPVREAMLIRSGNPGAELMKLERERQADATNLTLQAALQQLEDTLAQVKRLSLAYEYDAKKRRGKAGK